MEIDVNLPDWMLTRANEPLDEELVGWIVETEFFGQCLKHPLAFLVPFHPAMAFLANDELRHKREQLARYREARNWEGCVLIHQRPYRYDAFLQIASDLTDEEYWRVLRYVWVDTENPHEWDDIRDLFFDEQRRDTRALFMTDEERAQLAAMGDEITVYRGFCMPGAEEGWSWTIDRERAEWFARRFAHRGEAQLAIGTIRKADVVAYLTDRGEDEIVADPDDVVVTRIEVVGS